MTATLPPNTIDGAIDLGPFGTVDPTSHRFYRFLLNDQFLQKGTIFETVYFKFTIATPMNYEFWAVSVETPGGSSFLRFYDQTGTPIADNASGSETFAPPAKYTGPAEPGTYYLQIAPGAGLTSTARAPRVSTRRVA